MLRHARENDVSKANMICEHEKLSIINITLYHENTNIRWNFYRGKISELTIRKFTDADAGLYTCEAVNSLGKTNTSANISIMKGKNHFIYNSHNILWRCSCLMSVSFHVAGTQRVFCCMWRKRSNTYNVCKISEGEKSVVFLSQSELLMIDIPSLNPSFWLDGFTGYWLVVL